METPKSNNLPTMDSNSRDSDRSHRHVLSSHDDTRRFIASFYSKITRDDIADAVNELMRIQSRLPALIANRDWSLFMNSWFSRFAVMSYRSANPAMVIKTAPTLYKGWASRYRECYKLYLSEDFDKARRKAYDFLFYHRFDLHVSLRSVLELGGLEVSCVKTVMCNSLEQMVCLFAAIQYRIGRVAHSISIFQVLANLNHHLGEVAQVNSDLVSNSYPSFANMSSFPDYIKSNKLIHSVRTGDFGQARELLVEIEKSVFAFKGLESDLSYIHELLGDKERIVHASLGGTLLTARACFTEKRLDGVRFNLIKAMKQEKLSFSDRLIVNYNLAYISLCEGKFEDAVKFYELNGVALDAPPFVLGHYCTALILSDHREKAIEFIQTVPPKSAGEVNLMMARLYCSRNEWEFGLLRLIESNGSDWFTVKQIVLAFLMCVGTSRVRYGEFEKWNPVVEALLVFLGNQGELREANILLHLVERLRLPTLVNN